MAGVALVLLIVLTAVLTDNTGGTGAAPQTRPDNQATAAAAAPVVDVNLEALQLAPPELGEAQRNLFRFRAAPALPSPLPPLAPGPVVVPETPVAGPVDPPPPPPIPIKFIGLAGAPGLAGQVVFFSDGLGYVFLGKEGDIIEGRYRVLEISPDAAELAYLDGRGRQTIRLSGQ